MLISPAFASAATVAASLKPAFQADLTNTLKLQAGTGNPTFTRATTAYQTDFEGLMHQAISGEARFQGARRVQNILTAITNGDFSAWTAAGTPSGSTSGSTITFTGSGNDWRLTSQSPALVAGHVYTISTTVQRGTKTGTIALREANGKISDLLVINLPVNATRFSYTATAIASGAPVFGFDNRVAGAGDGVAGSILVTSFQVEDVTGQTNQNPSEYVNNGVMSAPYHGAGVDGVQYFNTLNGNTVASNVVTTGTGAKITSAQSAAAGGVTAGVVDATGPLGYLAEGARTNIAYPSDGSGTGWWHNGTASFTPNYASYNGLSFVRFVKGDGTEYTVIPTATVADNSTATASLYVKQDGTSSGTFSFIVWDNAQGPVFRTIVTVAANGVITAATATHGTLLSVEPQANGVYRISGKTSSYLSTTYGIQMMPVSGYESTLTVPSVLIAGAQMEVGAPFASSYIPTTGASATRNIDQLSYLGSNIANTFTSSLSVKLESAVVYSGDWRIYLTHTTWPQFIVATQAGASAYKMVLGGTHVDPSNSISTNLVRMAARSGSDNAFFVAGTKTSGGTTASFNSGDTIYVGSIGGASSAFANLRDIKIWKKALTDAQLVTLTSTNNATARSAIPQTTVKAPTGTGLVGYWKFDEGTGTKANDSSGLGHSGTLNGPAGANNLPQWVSGKLGKALSFDGTDDYVNVADNSSLIPSAITVEVWVKPSSYPYNYDDIVRKGYDVYEAVGGIFWSTDGSSGLYSGVTMTTGQWYHIVGTHDGTASNNTKVYVNGVLKATGTYTLLQQAGALSIGGTGGHYFNGSIDEVRVYNRALSAAEITALYKSTAAVANASSQARQSGTSLSSGLVGLWSFDGKDVAWTSATAGTAIDRVGGNTGTFTNMSRSASPVIGKIGQAMKLDGVDDSVAISSGLTYPVNWSDPFSLGLWIYVPSAAYWSYTTDPSYPNGVEGNIIAKGDYAGSVGITRQGGTGINGNSLGIWLRGSTNVFSTYGTITRNKWYHVVGTWDGDVEKLYINGALASSYTNNYSNLGGSPTSGAWDMGGQHAFGGNVGNYFNGTLDDVRMYNRALSATEVKSLYNLGR